VDDDGGVGVCACVVAAFGDVFAVGSGTSSSTFPASVVASNSSSSLFGFNTC